MSRGVPGLAVLVFFSALILPAFGETIDPFVMPSARSGGMGGTHAAFADDFYVLFTNPAALVDVEDQFSAAEITVSMYGPLFELFDMLTGYSGGDLDLSGIAPGSAGFDMAGPVALGWVGRRMGLGVFSRTRADIKMTSSMVKPVLSGEILLLGGYSFRFLDKPRHVLDGGFLTKGFYRGMVNMEASVFDAGDIINDFMGNPYETHLGMGLDLGLRYTFMEDLAVGLVCFDAYSPALLTAYNSLSDYRDDSVLGSSYATVRPRLNLGVSYRIHSGFLDRYISNLVVMLDYNDFLDLAALIPRNPILNIGLGAELRILQVLSLRLGIGDALPAAGFGLDLKYLKLDFAIHGKELGLDPGVRPTYAVDLGLLFRY
ncbi:MAG: hypothetical protein LBQ14_01475 [Treponema sp.]|jgi:hypothetical protein|nr:hypothetical protein [Treponema sp.]